LGEDVSKLDFDAVLDKYGEALIMREFEVGIMQEAIVNAFGEEK
jgi:hypothetical protein